ncbi:MAG: alpha-mannosidase, partial [Proteobacteria bacterium]|nr:alpha-mannosidase [Pseudomonadota bacterium]
PPGWEDCEIAALIDIDAEGCIYKDGVPAQGLTHKSTRFSFHRKRRYPVSSKAVPGEEITILMEAGANEIGGEWGDKQFFLRQAELAVFNSEIWKFVLDYNFLMNLVENLPEKSVRRKKIIAGLVKTMGFWNGGKGLDQSVQITTALLASPANRSSLDVISQGHAHLDLAWLWPIRETRRKAGRTFSTALALLDEYPEYKFGASQPQLFQWVKEDYPELYEKIKKSVKENRWECQGAMWVEPDMNLISGESIVRQCIHGLQFDKEEFDLEIKNLWLPDVFGFSSALPQILKKCGVDHFLSIKMAWNDTNEFPH